MTKETKLYLALAELMDRAVEINGYHTYQKDVIRDKYPGLSKPDAYYRSMEEAITESIELENRAIKTTLETIYSIMKEEN